MKLKVISGVSILAIIMNSNLFVYGQNNITNRSTKTNEIVEKNLVKDITIEGIEDNTTMYIGAHIDIKAYTDSESTVKDIEWVLNKYGVIDIISEGQEARITAINSGEASVMARAKDGSDVSRSININTEEYSNEKSEIKLTKGINPIKVTGINTKSFQVESDKSISNDEQIKSIDNFFIETAKTGYLKVIDSYAYNDNYEIYKIKIDGIETILELRVDKVDRDYYTKFIELITNIDNYNNGSTDPEKPSEPEEPGKPSEPEEPTEPEKPSELNPSNESSIIKIIYPDNGLIIDKGEASVNSPLEVVINKNISVNENKVYIKAYVDKLNSMGDLQILSINNDEVYTTYKFRLTIVSNKRNGLIKNDFYIDIKVNNEDVESYESIILMVDEDTNEDSMSTNEDNSENILDNTSQNNIDTNGNNYSDKLIEGNKYLNNHLNIINTDESIYQINDDTQKNYNYKKYNKVDGINTTKEIANKNTYINAKNIRNDISRISIIGVGLIGRRKRMVTRKYI